MESKTTLEDLIKKNGIIANPTEILVQITKHLKDKHESGAVHGKLNPASILIEWNESTAAYIVKSIDYYDTSVFPLDEWNFVEQDKPPVFEDDVFVLGCLFQYVLTNGIHPFGPRDHRKKFIRFNLYDLEALNECELGIRLRNNIIRKMINHNPKERPTLEELESKCFIFWDDEKIVGYLTNKAQFINVSESLSQKWNEIVLFPSTQFGNEQDTIEEILTVTEILEQIESSTPEKIIQLHKMYPDLLATLDTDEEPSENCFDKEDETEKEIKLLLNKNEPKSINNLLIAGSFFDNSDLNDSIGRHHGRLGDRYVHAFGVSDSETLTALNVMRYLNHPSLIQIFFVHPSNWVAVEPFEATLDKWIQKGSPESTSFVVKKDILTQLVKGLTYLHSEEVIHGTLSTRQVVIIPSGNQILAKISKFIHENSKNDNPTKHEDVKKLGDIFKALLENESDSNSHHVIGTIESFVPPSEAIIYHPFFWTIDKTKDFDEIVADTAMMSHLTDHSVLQNCTALQKWLHFQKYKNEEECGLYSYYHSDYNFPDLDSDGAERRS